MYGLQLLTKLLDQTITLNLNVRFTVTNKTLDQIFTLNLNVRFTVTNKTIRSNHYFEHQCTVYRHKQKY